MIIYFIYKNKSGSTKSTDDMEEEGLAHLVEGTVEMQPYKEDNEAKIENRSLRKGGSLPKTTVSRQYRFNNIIKTLSLSPYQSPSSSPNEDDLESGVNDHRP